MQKSFDKISIKFKLTTMKPLHAQWIIDECNHLPPFEGKKILAGWKASEISDALIKDLTGYSGGSVEPFYDIDPFNQGKVNFNIPPVVNCTSEEYIEKERVLAATDDNDNDGELLPWTIITDDSAEEEENDEEIDSN